VDTYEEEEPVDLENIAHAISNIDETIADVDSTITAYTKELSIKSPVSKKGE
jgi:type I restriction enzyme M protein